ncbi:MAG TPA: hypothetical protein VN648_23210, partial [Candidatus Methylomirabilis sp.]|nr:hypothetical protein [Candidatus Methylomirabilis sp.]
ALSLPTFNPGNPDRARSASGTWLVSTGGSGAHQIDPHPLRLAWAPNSRRFAYISPRDPQTIFAYDLDTGGSYVLTRVSGPVRGLSWAPDSLHLGVSYSVPWQGSGEGPKQIELALVTASNNSSLPMVDLPANLPGLPDPDLELHWVKSGADLWLWYLPAMIAVDASTGDVRSLMPLSRATIEYLRQPNTGSPGQVISQISPDGWYMANSFNEGIQGSADWVAVHFILPGADLRSIGSAVQRIGAVSALAWTGDSQNLIVAGGVDTAQPLWRMDPVSGEMSQLAQSVSFIGLRSNLLHQSLHALPEVNFSRQPQPADQTTWIQKDIPEYHLHFQMPLFWQYYGLDQNLGWALLTSGSFSNLFGVASIPTDQQVIQISAQPGDRSQNSPDLAGATWIETKMDGKTAYR